MLLHKLLTDFGARLKRLSQGNSIEDGQHGLVHTRQYETGPQAMEVDQSSEPQCVGTREQEETEPQVIEANQDNTRVSDISPFSLVCATELRNCATWGTIRWPQNHKI